MIYVMSDLHGNYEKYKEMLALINFSNEDTLIINGDICDRGADSVKIYMDILSRNNVFAIKGNHELMAEVPLEILLKKYSDKEIDIASLMSEPDFWCWIDNGGITTLTSLFDVDSSLRLQIFEFIKKMPDYKIVYTKNKKFVILHGGINKTTDLAQLNKADTYSLVWTRPDFDATYFNDENTFLIVGHTPTILINETTPASIYHGKGNLINIDCGAAYTEYGGRLGCLCLDTFEEFYV